MKANTVDFFNSSMQSANYKLLSIISTSVSISGGLK